MPETICNSALKPTTQRHLAVARRQHRDWGHKVRYVLDAVTGGDQADARKEIAGNLRELRARHGAAFARAMHRKTLNYLYGIGSVGGPSIW